MFMCLPPDRFAMSRIHAGSRKHSCTVASRRRFPTQTMKTTVRDLGACGMMPRASSRYASRPLPMPSMICRSLCCYFNVNSEITGHIGPPPTSVPIATTIQERFTHTFASIRRSIYKQCHSDKPRQRNAWHVHHGDTKTI